jgi:hypothetical protein
MSFRAAPRQKFNSTQLKCLHPGCRRWFKGTSARTKHYRVYHGPQAAMHSAAKQLSPDEPEDSESSSSNSHSVIDRQSIPPCFPSPSRSHFTPEIPLTDVPRLEHNMSPDRGSQRTGFSHSSNGPSQRQSSMPLYDRVVHHPLLNGMYVYLLYVFALTSRSYRETL